MGFITPNDFPTLNELYTAQLRYLLSTEKQIVKGLPDMIEHADNARLKLAFRSHLQETETHVTRLEELIGDVTGDADDKKDPILTAIAASGKNISKETDSGAIRDAGLIVTAQKIEQLRNRLLRECPRLGDSTRPVESRRNAAEDSGRGKAC